MRWTRRRTEPRGGATVVAVTALVAVLAGTACKDPVTAPIAAAHGDDQTPVRGGHLQLASFADIKTLDPAVAADTLTAEALELMFAGLVDFDAQGNVVPDLAERFEQSDDGLVYRFFLRQSALFQDGTPVTAEDVKQSIERALHPDTPSSFASFYDHIAGYDDYTARKTPHLSGVVVEGERVVAIHLREPDATFLAAFAMMALRPVCKSAGSTYSDTWKPCGAGPFKLLPGGWDRGRSLTLVRHEGYFRPGMPHFDAITWSYGMNVVTQRFKLEAGDLDMTHELGLGDTLRFQHDPRWKGLGAYDAAPSIQGEGMNVEMPPFDNVEVRRAVAAAIDRREMALLRTPNLTALHRVLPSTFVGDAPFPAAKYQSYDLAAALEHMKRAGYPYDPKTGKGGYPRTITYVVYKQGLFEATGQILQQQLARIGIHIELKIVSYPTYLSLTKRRHTVAMAPQAWLQDFPDESDFFEPLFASSAINDEDSNNGAFYSNPKLDALLKTARRELDPATRKKMYDQADAIVCEDAPWAMTLTYRSFGVHQPYVKGLVSHAVWPDFVREAWLDKAAKAVTARAGVLDGLGVRLAYGARR